jgi:hypothetical protein
MLWLLYQSVDAESITKTIEEQSPANTNISDILGGTCFGASIFRKGCVQLKCTRRRMVIHKFFGNCNLCQQERKFINGYVSTW